MNSVMVTFTNGTRVIISDFLPTTKLVQFRFPRSKGKRIRNKFKNNRSNYKEIPLENSCMVVGNNIIMNPETFERLRGNNEGLSREPWKGMVGGGFA